MTPSGPLTLQEVLDLATARSEGIGIAQAGVRRAEGEQVRSRSGLFPQLSASGGYDRALASEFSGVFDSTSFGGGTSSDGTNTDLSKLPFGRANTWRVSLAFSQNVYTGGRQKLQDQVAALGKDTATQGLTTARAQLLFDATQAYYDAALADRLVAIAEATVQQAGATLQQVQAGFDAGTQPEFEVLRARVNRDNQQPALIRQRVNRDLALLRLKQMLDIPADADLRLADALSDESLAPPPVFASRVADIERALGSAQTSLASLGAGITPPSRTVVAGAETTVRERETALKLAAAQKNPSVAVTSTYTRLGYPANGIPIFDRTNWTLSANVQLPILTGGRQRGDELVAKADLDDANLRLQQTRELATVDTQSAWAELIAARAAWEASSGTVQQAQRAYDIADVRYRNGVSTQLELSDSRLLLQQAEANRAQAARDLQVARARVALLPDLPLGATTAAAAARPAPPQAAPQAPAQQQQPSGQIQSVSAQPGAGQTTGTR
ncbi:MAG TPA: TolC family protein [Vicinamibacterales bacterium]|nr:TolC family protein [Vicinamibacterales bacterium]